MLLLLGTKRGKRENMEGAKWVMGGEVGAVPWGPAFGGVWFCKRALLLRACCYEPGVCIVINNLRQPRQRTKKAADMLASVRTSRLVFQFVG